jgi:HEAT repeat protein
LLLLVDGVNELPSDRGRTQAIKFRELYQKTCPMIFTTRELSAGGDLGIAKRLEMQPLTEPQMQQFVMAYLPTQGERLLRQLSGRLREFGQTPLLLWMLCSLFQQSEQIPPNLGMVFRAFTVGYGDRIKQDVTLSKDSRAWWGRLLQYLAFKMTCGESLTELQVAISRRGAEQFLLEFLRGKVEFADDCAMHWLEDLLKHHLIQISNDRIEFRHQLIQEYYAAEWLLGLLPSLSDARLRQGYLNYLKWTEPLALMLELVEGEEQAVRVVRLALEVDLRLGARLAGAVKYGFQEKTVGLLIQEIEERKIPQLYAIEFLGETRSDLAIESLSKIYEEAYRDPDLDHNVYASGYRVRGFAYIKTDSVAGVLIKSFYALSKIGSDKSIELLTQALRQQGYHIGSYAGDALGKIGNEKVIEILIKALKNTDANVRVIASSALGKIGSQKAVKSLIKSLEDIEPDVRLNAIYALGKIVNDKAIESIIKVLKTQFLKDDDLRVVLAAGEVLIDKLGGVKVDEFLAKALKSVGLLKLRKDADPLFHRIASLSLYIRLRSVENEVVEYMTQAYPRNFYSMNGKTEDTLNPIGEFVEPLIQSLKDSDSTVRSNAVKALCKIANNKVIESLISVLKDGDYRIYSNAVEVLVKIAGDDRNLPTLTQQLPYLLTLIPTEASQQALSVITAIQARCKYYNYDIAQTPLPPEDNPNPTTGNTYIFKAPVSQVVENLTVQRDNIATQNNQKTEPES